LKNRSNSTFIATQTVMIINFFEYIFVLLCTLLFIIIYFWYIKYMPNLRQCKNNYCQIVLLLIAPILLEIFLSIITRDILKKMLKIIMMSRSKTVFQFHPFPTPVTSSITPCRHPIPIDSLPPYMSSRMLYIFLSLILLV